MDVIDLNRTRWRIALAQHRDVDGHLIGAIPVHGFPGVFAVVFSLDVVDLERQVVRHVVRDLRGHHRHRGDPAAVPAGVGLAAQPR